MSVEHMERPGGPLITYTLFPDVMPTKCTERADEPWQALARRIYQAPTYISKSACPLISLAAYGEQRSDNNCIRHAANVLRIFGIEIDYDGEEVAPEEGARRLADARLQGIVYTSPSHTPGAPRWRALLPLAEPSLPEKRAEYVGRANRALGGIATRESFTLSQSFYIGRVRGATYVVIETDGRCVDEAVDLEPLYFTGHTNGASPRDVRTDDELRAAFDNGTDRYQAMLKLSSRWAARGMAVDDIMAALYALLGDGPGARNADGVDLRSRVEPMAVSAVRKFGGRRKGYYEPSPAEVSAPPDVDLPPIEAYADDGAGGDVAPSEDRAAAAPLTLRPLHEIVAERREPEWLIDDVLEANVLAVLAGPRSSFKSFVALDWGMRIAVAGQPVVILSGEGAGLDRRADAWLRTHGNGLRVEELPVFALERPLNLNQDTDLVLLKGAIERLGRAPALVIVDTFSKFSAGLDENDNGEVSTYLARLSLAIRQAFGSTVLLVAHSGHGDSGRPRGASALMANPDAEYIIARPSPTAMTITVSRERFKDSPSLPPIGYEAQVVELGRNDRRGRPVTSLALAASEAIVTPAGKRYAGVNQERAVTALRELHRANPACRFLTSQEIADLAKAQGINRKRRLEVVTWLVAAGILTPSVGGHAFDPTNL